MRLKRRIGIGARLIVGFTLIVLLLAALALYSVRVTQEFLQESVGQASIFLADEMMKRIDHNLYLRLDELQRYTKAVAVQETVRESNQEFEMLNDVQAYIAKKDQEWTSTPAKTITPLMQELIDNQLSEELRATFIEIYEKKYGYKVYSEIFITNEYGANVAQTDKTSDYRHDDEEWWQIAQERGWHVGDIEYDESVGAYGVGMAVRIDDNKGNWLGVMKAVVPVGAIAREAEIATRKYETTEIELITQEGQRIYATKPFRFLEDISQKEFFKKLERESDFFVAEEAGRERLFAYASSKGYRDFAGLPWMLVVEYDVDEILEPIFVLRNSIVAASAILIIVSVAIAFYISRSISEPVTKLKQAAEDIARGKLGIQIDSQVLSSNDEIGDLARSFDYMAKSLEQREREVVKRTRELEASEKALRESEEKYRAIFEQAADSIVLIDTETGALVEFNDRTHENLDYTREEFQELKIPDFEVIETAEEVARHIEKITREGSDFFETKHRTKGGEIRDILISSRTISIGGRECVQSIWRDITERKQAEEALRESEEKFRTFTESAPVAIMIYQNYRCIYTNPTAEKITGYTNDELLSMKFWDVAYPDYKDVIKDRGKAIARDESPSKQYELRIVAKDGSEKWIDGRLALIEYKGKRAALISAVDITERKQAEEALRESEERFRSLSASAPVGIFLTDSEGLCIYANARLQNIAGLTFEESLGYGWSRAIHPDDREAMLEEASKKASEGHEFSREFRILTPQGDLRWVHGRTAMIFSEEGERIGSVGTIEDITERKQAEEELRESEEKYRQLFELESDAVFLIDNETGRILEVNAAGSALYGYSREELLQKRNTDVSAEPDQTRQATVGRWSRVPVRLHRKKDGAIFPVEITSRHFTWRGREVHIAAIRDITKRLQAEEERERLLAELEAKNRELESFVYTVSHDLKAPLVSLAGFSSALLQQEYLDQLGERGKHYLKRIQANVAHMDALIVHLLDLSRVGRVLGSIEAIDVATLLKEIQEGLVVKLEEAGAEFIVQAPLPTIYTDRGRLRQVFTNLIDNALKFKSKERPLRIEVGYQKEREFYRFHVADNGLGIAPQYQEKIFAPFQRLEAETEGVGMGLALVKKIVEHHGGRVWVESEAGQGATFHFTIPIKKEEQKHKQSNDEEGD